MDRCSPATFGIAPAIPFYYRIYDMAAAREAAKKKITKTGGFKYPSEVRPKESPTG